jgi:N-acetylglucosaminyl-diphospho-decaprenol L-rhamnosyltransferase
MSADVIDSREPLGNDQRELNPIIKVLVIVVSYRTAPLVERCLSSLISERLYALSKRIEVSVCVIDNASGDAVRIRDYVVRADATTWIDVIVADKNGGFAYGNNLGIRHAFESDSVPDYFLLLNPDTEARAGAIVELVQFLEGHPDVGIAGSSIENEDGSLWPIAFRFPSLLGELNSGLGLGLVSRLLKNWIVAREMTDRPEAVDWIIGASMMLRRQLIEAVGGMDESYFLYYEETDYCRKVANAGWSIWYVPASRVMHAPGGSTGVTTHRERRQRLPAYWFESRRRFFLKNFGWRYAALTDIVYIVASSLGGLKLFVQGRNGERVPFLVRDTARHSPILPRNRYFAPAAEYCPPSRVAATKFSGSSRSATGE